MNNTMLSILTATILLLLSSVSSADQFDELPVEVLKPQIRTLPASAVKYKIVLKNLEPYLVNTIIVTEPEAKAMEQAKAKALAKSQAKTKSKPKSKPAEATDAPQFATVHSFFDRHLLGATGTKIFVDGLHTPEHNQYMFISQDKTFLHPLTGENLGTTYTVLGTGRLLTARQNSLATMEITNAKQPIEPGAILIAKTELNLPEVIEGKIYQGNSAGFILANVEGVWDVGKYNSVIISMGAREGLQVGDVLSIYRADKEDILSNIKGYLDADQQSAQLILPEDAPLTLQGELMVYKTFEKLSLAVVVKAEIPITIHDIVKKAEG